MLFTLVAVILILIVLVQKGRGGGLAGAFGGGGGGNTAFGAKTGDVLTWATSVIFGVFLLLAIALNWMSDYRRTILEREAANNMQVQTQPAPSPARPSTPAPSPKATPSPAPAAPTTR